MIELGVNIDHIATLREARRTNEPDPVWGAVLAELGGADGITVHLREDRRHIQDRDVRLLRETVRCKLNLEMSIAPAIVKIASELCPEQVTLVPERREEITTEGGLDVVAHHEAIQRALDALQTNSISKKIPVSLFLDPDLATIEAALKLNIDAIELHTGSYALAKTSAQRSQELTRLRDAAALIVLSGKRLHAGHGLTYHNVRPICEIPQMQELNIGHSIIARSIMVGLKNAVREMKELLGT